LAQKNLSICTQFHEAVPFLTIKYRSVGQEILQPLWNSNVHCNVHKLPPLALS